MTPAPTCLPARHARALRAWTALLACALLLAAPRVPAQAPDAQAFDALLRAHVKAGHVDYPAFEGNAAFKGYLAALARPARPSSMPEKLAHYINAYNAFAIEGILEGLSPSTLFGRQRYFKFKDWDFDGREVTLDELEHKLIRPLGEPRIHFAVICASRSCPPLRSEAYVASRLDAQLEENARGFVNDTFRNRFDKHGRVAHLSEIFKWFEEDFVKSAGSVQKFLARYVADPEVARDLAAERYEVKWIPYDWNLNGTPPRGG